MGQETVTDRDRLDFLIPLVKLLSDQVSALRLELDALRLTLQTREPELQESYLQKVRALEAVRGIQRDRVAADLQQKLETERMRQLFDSLTGKPQ